jgi:hypothetical protein
MPARTSALQVETSQHRESGKMAKWEHDAGDPQRLCRGADRYCDAAALCSRWSSLAYLDRLGPPPPSRMLWSALGTVSFFQYFDKDKLLRQVLPLISDALDAWQRGMSANEEALMNQITSALNTRRARRCDVGLNGPYLLRTALFDLHRHGPSQTDRYGSDLAVTVTSDTTPTVRENRVLPVQDRARKPRQYRSAPVGGRGHPPGSV